jgi:hypothetical protein
MTFTAADLRYQTEELLPISSNNLDDLLGFGGHIERGASRRFTSLAAQRLKLVISDNGRLVKKPHLAFERDLIALYLATFQTAETTTIE